MKKQKIKSIQRDDQNQLSKDQLKSIKGGIIIEDHVVS